MSGYGQASAGPVSADYPKSRSVPPLFCCARPPPPPPGAAAQKHVRPAGVGVAARCMGMCAAQSGAAATPHRPGAQTVIGNWWQYSVHSWVCVSVCVWVTSTAASLCPTLLFVAHTAALCVRETV